MYELEWHIQYHHFITFRQGVSLNRDLPGSNYLTSASSLTIDASLEACTAMPDFFMWVLGILTQVLILSEQVPLPIEPYLPFPRPPKVLRFRSNLSYRDRSKT